MNTGNTILTTRKIQLIINSTDKVQVGEVYRTLYQWQHACFRAANFIFTHLYVQEQMKDLLYITDGIRVKLADQCCDSNGILTTSRLNTTYRVLAAHFKGQVPMHILGSLNMTLSGHFHNEKQAYLQGERSVRNYKRTIPIPFRGTDTKQWQLTADEKNYTFTLFGISFRTYLGRDTNDKTQLLHRMMAGQVRLCSSSIQLQENKIFLLATFRVPANEQQVLDDTVIAEASLSIEYPITVSIGRSHYRIGTKEEFLYRRLAIQAAYKRVQQATSYTRGGKGRMRKLKPLQHFAKAEVNYVHNRLHLYSRRLIDICIRNRAATLVLTGQHDKEEAARQDDFLLRNWSYYELKEKIAYKAQRAGIMVIEE